MQELLENHFDKKPNNIRSTQGEKLEEINLHYI